VAEVPLLASDEPCTRRPRSFFMESKETINSDARTGATAEFPFDRMTVERFREAFPRARWSDTRKAWFVPGKTASKRISNWLARLEAEGDTFADEKGRDAYSFDPFESRYLEAGTDGFRTRTPFSRTVVNELRDVPFSRWDGDLCVWYVPYRSVENLRRRWPVIESAALRNESSARKERQVASRGSPEGVITRARAAERRKKRYPVPSDDFPPVGRPVSTLVGIISFEGTTGELAEPETLTAFYPEVSGDELVWATWQRPDLDELVVAWPAKKPPNQSELRRGWWLPTLAELRPARREAKARDKSSKTLRGLPRITC